MYHWEADQEDFLVLSGEALLIVEGDERPLRQWDLVHCPAGTKHVIVGAGDGPCLVLAVGARDRSTGPDWGAFGDESVLGRFEPRLRNHCRDTSPLSVDEAPDRSRLRLSCRALSGGRC